MMLRRGDGFGRIGIGVPYYKAHYEFFRWWSHLLATGLRDGDALLNNMNVPGEVPIPLAHNAIVREFLSYPELDTLCMVEDDHEGDGQVIERMRTKEENYDFDIVCASYPSRRGDWMCVGADFYEDMDTDYGEYGMKLEPARVQETGTQQYDVAALGCVLIRRWVLEAMRTAEDPEDCFWFDWHGRNSQDVTFYWGAKQVGARAGVDRDNRISHFGKKRYTMEQFYKLRAAQQARKEAET